MYVSVVMATHNRPDFVGQAIESVLNQHHKHFELIIVDDGSTDRTKQIVKGYARRDRRIRTVQFKQNMGIMAAANAGLILAKHDLIARIDDDDLMVPERLDRQVQFMLLNPSVTVVTSWAHLINESGKLIGRSCPKINIDRGKKELRPEVFLNCINSTAMYRRKEILKLGGYRSAILEDRDLWGRVITAGHIIAVQPEFLMYVRHHRKSLSSTNLTRLMEVGNFIDFNVVQRMRGNSELSHDEYKRYLSSLPLLVRKVRALKLRSRIAYSRAITSYVSRDWLGLFGNLLIALAFNPFSTTTNIKEKFSFMRMISAVKIEQRMVEGRVSREKEICSIV